ncbi:MAG: hypothetical protein AAF846_15695 [Chloroflexota bacterium]
MQVRNRRGTQMQQINRWWARTRQYTSLSHRLTQGHAKDLMRIQDFDACIYSLNAQFQAIEAIPYPESARHIRQALLAFIMNTMTATQHARLQNDDDRNVIFDIAMVDKNMLELYLGEYGLAI